MPGGKAARRPICALNGEPERMAYPVASCAESFRTTQGLVWIGTRDGLNRYDVCDFKVHRYDSDDSC